MGFQATLLDAITTYNNLLYIIRDIIKLTNKKANNDETKIPEEIKKAVDHLPKEQKSDLYASCNGVITYQYTHKNQTWFLYKEGKGPET